MNKVRKVVEYRRKTDGSYECVELEPSMPRLCESNESKSLLKIAAYGNTVCRIKGTGRWAKLRLVSAGTYSVGCEQITVLETYIVVSKR